MYIVIPMEYVFSFIYFISFVKFDKALEYFNVMCKTVFLLSKLGQLICNTVLFVLFCL